MMFLDRFVDTRDKRVGLIKIIALLLVFYVALTYVCLATHLLFVENYDDAYALLQVEDIQQTYLARVLINCISVAEITLLHVMKSILVSFHFIDVISICSILLLAFKSNTKQKGMYRFICLLGIVSFVVCGLFALLALDASTLLTVITMLHYIGITIFVASTCSVVYFVYVLFYFEIKVYQEALLYDVEEIKELP